MIILNSKLLYPLNNNLFHMKEPKCPNCFFSQWLPPGVSSLIGSYTEKELPHLSNIKTHTLTQLPIFFKGDECPCHCPHISCDICCFELLSPEAQEKLFARMEENNVEVKRLKEKMKLKAAKAKRLYNQRWRNPRRLPEERKNKTRGSRRRTLCEAY